MNNYSQIKNVTLIVSILCYSLCFSSTIQAKSNASMKVSPGMYKIKSGTKLPVKGPVIDVYAEGASTKYTHIANTHQTQPLLVKYTASCSNKGKLSGGSIAIGNAKTSIDKGDGFSSESVWVNVPHHKISHINPPKHCNTQAKSLSIQQGKPLAEIVKKGFVMKIPNVLSAKGTAFCSAAGLGKGDVTSDTTNGLGVFIHCKANPDARSGSKTTGTGHHKPDPGQTTQTFKTAKLKAKTPNYTGTCPVGNKFTGSITATGKGTIEYQIIGDGGYKSPVKKIQFDKAGTQNFEWTRMIRKKDKTKTLAVAGSKPNPNQIKGWMQLKVTYRIKNKMASAKKTWHSKKQNFTVNCTDKATLRLSQ